MLSLLSASLVHAKNMNGKPGQYKIANPSRDENSYSTDYDDATEFFDVYSPPIKTRYSEVFWKVLNLLDLPEEIVERFSDNKVMAVIGYEPDQVQVNEVTGEEKPVPITWAYNHHYVAVLWNYKKARVSASKMPPPGAMHPLTSHRDHYVMELVNEQEILDYSEEDFGPATLFSEANGGEFRLSYHGYPKGYAQLIESPNSFQLTPMQIDTWNREKMDSPKYEPGGPLPRSSRIPPEAGYSGLLECPCSDRREFEWGMTYKLDSAGALDDICTGPIEDANECFAGARLAVEAESYVERRLEADVSKPSGCSVEQHADGMVDIVWNSGSTKTEDLDDVQGDDVVPGWISFRQAQINISVALSTSTDTAGEQGMATITLVGPADKWFGVGFGTNSMCAKMEADECPRGGPYAIIVSGDNVEERKLDFHGPGTVIESSVTIVSNEVNDENRTVVLTRPWVGATPNHFTFEPKSSASVPIITARGCGLVFAQHCGHGPSELEFIAMDTPTSLCQAGIEGTIAGNAFVDKGRCYPFPAGDLLNQGNPTCSITTYQGGLSCCVHGESLLDKDQDIPWPDEFLEYRLKFRFYFEEYKPATVDRPASHQNLVRLYWQTEAFAGEYDIVPCRENEQHCVHTITSRWQVHQMLSDCLMRQDGFWCSVQEPLILPKQRALSSFMLLRIAMRRRVARWSSTTPTLVVCCARWSPFMVRATTCTTKVSSLPFHLASGVMVKTV